MNLFAPNFEQPGPGVAADEPRKKGLPRLWEVLRRDFWSFYVSGGLALLAALPLFAGVLWGVLAGNLAVAALGGLLGGALAGTPFCCLMDTVFRALRDEPGYWWHTYQRVFKENARRAAALGAGFGGLGAVQAFALCGLLAKGQALWGGLQLLGLLLCGLLAFFSLAQTVLVRCTAARLLKNSLLLAVGFLPRALLAAGIWALYGLLLTRTAGLTLLLLALGNLWAPVLGSCFAVYKTLDDVFQLEKGVEKLQQKKYGF